MTTQLPVVSVILPTRNRRQQLAAAIESVCCQRYPQLELIVVDDGSDPPATVPPEDARIRLIRLDRSIGAAAARNRGFSAATGAYICLLDDDDSFLPGKLETQARYLAEHPEVDLVFSQVTVLEPDGARRIVPDAAFVFDPISNLREFNVIHPNAAMFKRELTGRLSYDERLTRFTDTQFFMAAALRCTVHYLPVPVAVWRHDERPDRMTAADPVSTYRNFQLLRELFEPELGAWPEIRREFDAMQAALELDVLRARFLVKSEAPA